MRMNLVSAVPKAYFKGFEKPIRNETIFGFGNVDESDVLGAIRDIISDSIASGQFVASYF